MHSRHSALQANAQSYLQFREPSFYSGESGCYPSEITSLVRVNDSQAFVRSCIAEHFNSVRETTVEPPLAHERLTTPLTRAHAVAGPPRNNYTYSRPFSQRRETMPPMLSQAEFVHEHMNPPKLYRPTQGFSNAAWESYDRVHDHEKHCRGKYCEECNIEDDSFTPYALGEGLSLVHSSRLPLSYFSSAIAPEGRGWGGLLSQDRLAELIQFGRQDDVLLIDVRPPRDFERCHIDSAVNIAAVPDRGSNPPVFSPMRAGQLHQHWLNKVLLECVARVFVVYDWDSSRWPDAQRPHNFVLGTLMAYGSRESAVCLLDGGFAQFVDRFPELVSPTAHKPAHIAPVSSGEQDPDEDPIAARIQR